MKNIKHTHDVTVRYVVLFVMLDTSQIVTPINPALSQHFEHNCDHDPFNVDCSYDILRQLLCICMSTKTSVKFQIIHH